MSNLPPRSFIRTSKAWYNHPTVVHPSQKDNLEEFGFRFDFSNVEDVDLVKKIDGEFFIRWHLIGGEENVRLEAFGDSWNLLPYFADVFQALNTRSPNGVWSGDQFHEALVALGMVDTTPTKFPKDVRASIEARLGKGAIPPAKLTGGKKLKT